MKGQTSGRRLLIETRRDRYQLGERGRGESAEIFLPNDGLTLGPLYRTRGDDFE